MPTLPRNCYKTPHGFLFRIVVPEALRPAIGKREIKKALGKDYREAVSQARLLALQVDRQFSELQEQTARHRQNQDALGTFLATPADKHLKPITKIIQELAGGLRSLWLACLDADLAVRMISARCAWKVWRACCGGSGFLRYFSQRSGRGKSVLA